MKFITVRDLRTSPSQIWKKLPKEQEMIITNNGKPIALLTPISDNTLEEDLAAIRKARAISAIERMQQHAHAKGLDKLDDADIQKEIDAARKNS